MSNTRIVAASKNTRMLAKRPEFVWKHSWSTTRHRSSREHRETKPERAYAAWLARRLGDAADIELCRLTRFSPEDGRRGRQRMPRGPSAVLQGTLRIRSGEAFRRLVQAGIGRHKAYGYGMLLLRPAEQC